MFSTNERVILFALLYRFFVEKVFFSKTNFFNPIIVWRLSARKASNTVQGELIFSVRFPENKLRLVLIDIGGQSMGLLEALFTLKNLLISKILRCHYVVFAMQNDR